MTSRDEGLASNRALWDEWTDIHETSESYDLESFRQGGSNGSFLSSSPGTTDPGGCGRTRRARSLCTSH